MYCMATKKKPKLAKKRKVIPTAPVAKSGLPNSRTSSSGWCVAVRRSRTATASATPAAMQPHTTGWVQPRAGASTTPNTNTATAAPISTAPIQSIGVAVSSRDDPNRARADEHADRRGRERIEDRLPREEVQQEPGAQKSDDRTGTRHARPDANGLVALRLRERGGQQRQRRGHDERRTDARHRPRDDDLHGAVEVSSAQSRRARRRPDRRSSAPRRPYRSPMAPAGNSRHASTNV